MFAFGVLIFVDHIFNVEGDSEHDFHFRFVHSFLFGTSVPFETLALLLRNVRVSLRPKILLVLHTIPKVTRNRHSVDLRVVSQ